MSPATPDQYDMIIYRLTTLENTVKQLQEQFRLYVPVRENDLQLNAIHVTTERTEREIQDIKSQIKALDDKIETQGKESQRRDTEQSDSLSKLQIKVLWGTISVVLAIFIAVAANYLSHFTH